jgi:hypothetical protein
MAGAGSRIPQDTRLQIADTCRLFSRFTDSSSDRHVDERGWLPDRPIGKCCNGYIEARASYVPPGRDRWTALATTDVGGARYCVTR